MSLRRTVDGQQLNPILAGLAPAATALLSFTVRHPTAATLKVLDANFAVLTANQRTAAPVRELTVSGADGATLAARLYEPDGLEPEPALLVYYHGGGWTVGSLDSHQNLCRAIAARARCKVLAIGYRKAPKDRFPAAWADACAAFGWALDNAAALGVDRARIAVGGDSAGGNLAAAVALAAEDPARRPCFAWLNYPLVDADVDEYPSTHTFGTGLILTRQNLRDMVHHYVPRPAQQLDPRVSMIHSEVLDRMPPTYISTAGMDPLRDQGTRFAERLRAAGVEVRLENFPNLPHAFQVLLIDPESRRATEATCDVLARALAVKPAGQPEVSTQPSAAPPRP
jgi:acetyl esterase